MIGALVFPECPLRLVIRLGGGAAGLPGGRRLFEKGVLPESGIPDEEGRTPALSHSGRDGPKGSGKGIAPPERRLSRLTEAGKKRYNQYHIVRKTQICRRAERKREGTMDWKKSYALMWMAYLAGATLLMPPLLLGTGKGWMAAAVLVMAAGYYQTVFFLNCPRCGYNWVRHRAYLPRIPRRCPRCGEFIW